MANPTKFLGSIPVSGWSFNIDNGGAPEAVTLTDGDYYLSGDNQAGDLLREIINKVEASAIFVSSGHNFSASISSAGLVSLSTSAGTYTLTWTTGGETLRDVLRYSGSTLALSATPQVGARAARYFAHTDKPTAVDIPTLIGRIAMDESDDGTIRVNDLGPLVRQYRVKVRYTGGHRTSTANGYTEFQDLFIYCLKAGRNIRWYPDTTVTTAWEELTNPSGYHVCKALEPKTFSPVEVIRDYYGWYTTTFLLQVQP